MICQGQVWNISMSDTAVLAEIIKLSHPSQKTTILCTPISPHWFPAIYFWFIFFFPKKGSVLSNITLILHSILPNQRSGMQNIPSKPSVSPETACQERKLTGCPLSPRGPCGPMGPVSPWNEDKYSGEWEISDREASKPAFKNVPIKLHCLWIREKQH